MQQSRGVEAIEVLQARFLLKVGVKLPIVLPLQQQSEIPRNMHTQGELPLPAEPPLRTCDSGESRNDPP